MRNQSRVQMRVCETMKYWNLMMENFSQVVAEGATECEAMKNKVHGLQDSMQDVLYKAYHYGEPKSKAVK